MHEEVAEYCLQLWIGWRGKETEGLPNTGPAQALDVKRGKNWHIRGLPFILLISKVGVYEMIALISRWGTCSALG